MNQHRLNILKLSDSYNRSDVLECIKEIERLHDVLELIAFEHSNTVCTRYLAQDALDARY